MEAVNFSDLKPGDRFRIVYEGAGDRERVSKKVYAKEEEARRPYTPEAYTNASFLWRTIDPETNDVISQGTTYLHFPPTALVIRFSSEEECNQFLDKVEAGLVK